MGTAAAAASDIDGRPDNYRSEAVSVFGKSVGELVVQYEEAATELESLFRELEAMVPKPVQREYKDSFVYRYEEQSKEQAIVQKLARTISHLNAAILLAKSGYCYEQGMLQRMLDEDEQDIKILTMSLIYNDHQPVHEEYLNWFWFDSIAGDLEERYPGEPRRQKVYSYLATGPAAGPNPHGHITALKALKHCRGATLGWSTARRRTFWVFSIPGTCGTPCTVWRAHRSRAITVRICGTASSEPGFQSMAPRSR